MILFVALASSVEPLWTLGKDDFGRGGVRSTGNEHLLRKLELGTILRDAGHGRTSGNVPPDAAVRAHNRAG